MRCFVPVLFAAAVFALPSVGAAASMPTEAQYVYGTVKSIPQNTIGSLDLTDSTDLQFRFGKGAYRLPYSRIKSFQFSDAKEPSRSIAHVPVPRMPFRNRAQVLDVSYRQPEGGVGTISFRLTGKSLSSAEWMLSERIEADKKATRSASRTKLPESWWGDKNWKTNRNKAAWADAAAEPTGTK